MIAINLQTEYMYNPIGIDITAPRLFWNCKDGTSQTAYHIVAKDEMGNIMWDSGEVSSSSMSHILWGGKCLDSRKRIYWKVTLCDENGVWGDESETAYFETGLLDKNDWKGNWITGDYDADKTEFNKKNGINAYYCGKAFHYLKDICRPENVTRYPVDCFRKRFNVSKQIKKARLYATACGIYEVRINNSKAGDIVLAPGITDYRKRIQYQTIDVTSLINNGENLITAELADGWYRGSVGAWGLKQEYGWETKFLCQLEIEFDDGSTDIVYTDSSWQWSNDGPIRFADNKDGEIIDAALIPSYNGFAKETTCDVIPTSSNNVAIKEHEIFTSKVIHTNSGKSILDFGQNIAGYVTFSVNAKSGDKIILRFGEMLDENGEFTQKNIQINNKHIITPLQKIEYTCKDGLNDYKTKFAIFGFQYVLVEGDVEITPNCITAIAVYSDISRTGYFSSSNELLNKLVEATVWSTKNNSADIPTDCPTRERHGWTGDAQIFFPTASYLFNYSTFADKYLRDMYDWQQKDGKLPQIAPCGGTDFYMFVMNGSVGWADAGIIIPYAFYKKFNDIRILEKYYDGMVAYAEFMTRRIGKNGVPSLKHKVKGQDAKYIVNAGQSYGEWAEPADVYPNDWKNTILPHTEVSTAYTSYVLGLMSEICKTLGHNNEAERYLSFSQNCAKGYRALVRTDDYSLDTDRQACLVRPLAFNLLDEGQKKYASKRLIKALENYGWRLGTGFLSTPLIMSVLEKIDIEAAYRLLENEKMPGWLFMPKMGATTIWESWEGTQAQGGIASLDHYSKGAVCEWLFSSMCGIVVDGENHFRVNPKPGGHFTFAKAEYLSVFGNIVSGWVRKEDKTVFEVIVPSNTTATFIGTDGQESELTAGKHTFEF